VALESKNAIEIPISTCVAVGVASANLAENDWRATRTSGPDFLQGR
jgi:hypothetical protein